MNERRNQIIQSFDLSEKYIYGNKDKGVGWKMSKKYIDEVSMVIFLECSVIVMYGNLSMDFLVIKKFILKNMESSIPYMVNQCPKFHKVLNIEMVT